MKSLPLNYRALFAAAACWTAMAGCGGGGGVTGSVTGIVTDVDGRSVTGAVVATGSNSAVTASNGSFSLSGVTDGYRTFVASTTVDGHRWSGETQMDVVGGHQNRSLNIVVSDERFQGALTGTVIDSSGFVVDGAKVFIGGPYGSTLAVTDRFGSYRANRLTPGVTYTVTASLAGYINDKRTVHIDASTTSTLSFALTPGTSAGAIPAPTNVSAQAWTVAYDASRAANDRSVYDWLKQQYRKQRGLTAAPNASKVQIKNPTRLSPLGSLVEVDLFWDYQSFTDLYGYGIKRATSAAALPGTNVNAVLRDPLASAFADADFSLTPDQPYYYTVHRLDTIEFPDPRLQTVGPASAVVTANPLQQQILQRPFDGGTVGSAPVLNWSSVNGAAAYQVYVWDRYPSLQFMNSNQGEPAAVKPIWPADPANPGSSLVLAPNLSQTYGGPSLVSGHTYYWMVVAQDTASAASAGSLSASKIYSFTR